MRFGAPMIAWTGHAAMHSVQPMHGLVDDAREGGPARLRPGSTAVRSSMCARAATWRRRPADSG